MTAAAWAIAGTAFLASSVEAVEALTIVLAVGVAHRWRTALAAAAAALAVLAVVVGVAGPHLPALAANRWIRLAFGLVALYVGVTWLRKAVLQAAGRKAQRDEAASFARRRDEVSRATEAQAFAAAFNGVLVEGIEVVAIVLALGSASGGAMVAAAEGAALAVLAVTLAGIAVRTPLSRIPENVLKYVVGVMVTGFGLLWTGEGLGIAWPAEDGALFYLAGLTLCGSLIAVRSLTPRRGPPTAARTT